VRYRGRRVVQRVHDWSEQVRFIIRSFAGADAFANFGLNQGCGQGAGGESRGAVRCTGAAAGPAHAGCGLCRPGHPLTADVRSTRKEGGRQGGVFSLVGLGSGRDSGRGRGALCCVWLDRPREGSVRKGWFPGHAALESAFTIVHFLTLAFTIVHFHTLAFTIVHFHTLAFTIVHFLTLAVTIIHFHALRPDEASMDFATRP
jgi:hypothetical protein